MTEFTVIRRHTMHVLLVRVLAVLLIWSGSNTVLAVEFTQDEWIGTFTWPSNKEEDVKFHLIQDNDMDKKDKYPIEIEILFDDDDFAGFQNITKNSNELSFKLNTGDLYECILDLELNDNGQYSGYGHDSEDKQRKISFIMIPPEDSEIDLTGTQPENTVEDTEETDEIK